MGKDILGFRCSIDDAKVRKAIRSVLERVRKKSPEDFKRLRRRGLSFSWLPKEETRNGTKGHFYTEKPNISPCEVEKNPDIIDEPNWPGGVKISRELTDSSVIAIIAHELGHAATISRDFHKRRRVFPSLYLADEACANKYAFKWGFSKQLRKERKRLGSAAQHLVLPGQSVQFGEDVYKMTRNFYLRKEALGKADAG